MFTKSATINFLDALVKNLQRETQKSFVLADIVEEFSKASDPNTTYYGIRYYFAGGQGAVRFNYAKSDNFDNVRSIDIWTSPAQNPQYSIVVDEETSLVEALDEVKRVLRGLKMETVMRADADVASPTQKKIDPYLVAGDRSDEDVDKLFEDLEKLVKSVSSRYITSVLILGSAGAGKSFVVKKSLKGTDYLFRSGHTSPMGIYMTLHDHPDSIIVYDDTDSVFDDQKSVNILKHALDTSPEREISWDGPGLAAGYEKDFVFTGGIIFISNLTRAEIVKKTQGAIASRSPTIEINLTSTEVLGRINRILDKISPETSMEEKQEVLQAIFDNYKKKGGTVSTRALVVGIGLKKANPSDWKGLMQYV